MKVKICPICGSRWIHKFIGTIWRQTGPYKCIQCYNFIIPLVTPQEIDND